MAIKPPDNHDWKTAPIYREWMLCEPEEEALKDTELVQDALAAIQEEKKPSPKKKKKKSQIRRSSSSRISLNAETAEMFKDAVERAHENMLTEAEITYVIKILKTKEENKGNDLLKESV